MAVERVDYYSDEEYQQALQWEEQAQIERMEEYIAEQEYEKECAYIEHLEKKVEKLKKDYDETLKSLETCMDKFVRLEALNRELKQVLQDFINAISKKVALTKYDTEVINVKKTLEKAEEKSTIEILKEEMKNKKNVDIQENKMFPRA